MEDQKVQEVVTQKGPLAAADFVVCTSKSNKTPTRARTSPLSLWPCRGGSPKNTKTVPIAGHEDTSFALFTGSFDTLSEPGHYLRENATSESYAFTATPLSPVTARGNGSGGSQYNNGGCGIDIALPELTHDAGSEYSLGDISPIKIVYGGPTATSETRHLENQVDILPLAVPKSIQTRQEWGQSPTDRSLHGAASNPFYVIRTSFRVFENCKYLLPCLRGADVCPVYISEFSHIRHYKGLGIDSTLSNDLKIAIRRVEAAVCAFGGTLNTSQRYQTTCIFRSKGADSRLLYKQRLPYRYYLSGSHISWEVEENPPIYITTGRDQSPTVTDSTGTNRFHTDSPSTFSGSGAGGRTAGVFTPSPSTPDCAGLDGLNKMKYRCKLCGQPKQNHNCPYRQFLQRSIGVMVYPAVNSFTAAEPGIIAPPLTKMNNFVSYDDEGSPSPECTADSTVDSIAVNLNTVTPEAFRDGSAYFHSPQSSLSVPSENTTPPPRLGPTNYHTVTAAEEALKETLATRKRTQAQAGVGYDFVTPCTLRSTFVTAVPLKQEHYRAVTPMHPDEDTSLQYQYAVIPLTFAERKRMSETLFHLTKEIPTMTADCAAVLREARENAEWDLAVAELLTQVVVGLYCDDSDIRLDGLQQYLLSLGVSC